jgi:hypothetical protein
LGNSFYRKGTARNAFSGPALLDSKANGERTGRQLVDDEDVEHAVVVEIAEGEGTNV